MKVRLYKTYLFKDKDPVIDELRTIMQDTHTSKHTIATTSGVSVACLSGWFGGATRRPQHATVRAVAGALGYDYRLIKTGPVLTATSRSVESKKKKK